MTTKSIKVIFDTNIWISFLIGKRLSKLQRYISDGSVTIVITEQLLKEIRLVTEREKLKKYFPKTSVQELLSLLDTIAEKVDIRPTHFMLRDPKDNFLLDLIDFSGADYLVTGDKDVLEHNSFKTARIITPFEFAKLLENSCFN